MIIRHALRAARDGARGLAELLLPATCPACRALTDEDQPLCAACDRTLDPIDHPCPRCALPLPSPAPGRAPPACLGCQRAPPRWSEARAPFSFTGELAVAIRRWKLGGDPALTPPLARLLVPSLAEVRCDALVPVPLHPRRLRAREFNQASLLARAARRALGDRPPPVAELLDRVRDTPPQARLDAATRRAQLRHAFAPAARRDVRGAHLCLVDDVLTTGATASECARTLLAAGARRVDVLTLARTLP